MGSLHFAASFPAWTLAALAIVPTVLAVRLAAQLDRAPAFIAMLVGLAAWLVLTSIEHLVPGAAHWPAQCLAIAVPALFWVGARQWCAHPRPWVVPGLVAVATALLQVKALEEPSTGVISSAWTAEKIGWLLACATAWAGTGALDAQGLARTRTRRISLWIAAAAPAILAALGGALVTHPAPYLPLVGVLAWLVRASGVGLTGMNRLAEPMIAIDGKGWVIDGNSAAFALLGVPGGNLRRFQAHVVGTPGLRSLLQDPTRECAEIFTGTNAATRRCHEARVIRSPGDESGRRVIAIQDVTSRRQSEQELVHQARFDSLTGLANRRFFIARLHDELAAAVASGSTLAVMYIDLDRFKAINDSYGHAAGDELLRTVAHRLRQRLRGSDVLSARAETWLARLGGDEFALLLPGIDSIDDATGLATRLLAVLGEPMMLEGSKVWNAASIGIALYPEHAHDVDSLLRAADAALYAAKTEHRGNYQIFEPALTERARRQATIDRLLRAALASNALEVHYQPKYSLGDRSLGGAEALLRWHDAELGTVGPKEFVPVAEETGLIGPLGEWVLERVCSDMARWRSEGIPIVPISFNVSNKQFAEADMGRMIIDKLKRYSLDPHWLEMELTESSILEDDERTAACLRAIREVGMRISLDDFGTGYSSLSCLNRVPLDLLKIDRGLVRDVHTDPGARGVASAVVSMAHSLALEVVAEGVDCEEQAEVLSQMGCDWVQGFAFAAAMAERPFAALLARTAQAAVGTGEARRPGLSSDTQPEPEHRSDEACALIIDDGTGRLGVLAMRLNRIGVAALYASVPDEGLLFAAESNAPIRTLMTCAGAEVAAVTRLLDRIQTASGRAPALLFVVEDQLPKSLLELRSRCRIWTLREPATDAELRDVAQSTLHGTPPGAVQRQHPRAACDSIATVTIGDDVQSALLTSLSVQGAFIELLRRPPEGTSLDIIFALPDAEIRTRATVAYQRADSADHGPAGIGVVFQGLSAQHRDAIRTTVEQGSVRCLA